MLDLFGRPERGPSLARQLPLPLGWRPRAVPEPQLLVDGARRALLDALLAWADWPVRIARLVGPPRSGKSSLAAHVAATGAPVHVVDPAEDVSEVELFHACTNALAGGTPLLLVATSGWTPSLPDLATRVAAACEFVIPELGPDMFSALLHSRLAAHHVAVSPDAVAYMGQRAERSYAALDQLVETLLQAALADGRSLTLPVVRAAAVDAGLLPLGDWPARSG